ncbi:MAG: tRNA preQ1(34) S-adenosylmethionine ribosyltransferase-isomerase QueA [Gammaproteobacteria bacterium]|nr:tRNA preQ1(34) S-adenosylmethionine ribosyltransferase-isomerase QueA [Gammaproteobacteria bacterium]
MLRSDFSYPLPPELIAQHPPAQRGDSRLLVLPADGDLADRQFQDLPGFLQPDDLLVLNDTRVIPARLFGVKASGGRVEVLVERLLDEHRLLAQVRVSKPLHGGGILWLGEDGGLRAEVLDREGEFYQLALDPSKPAAVWLERYGHMPLPPYIDRADDALDHSRYQTVYGEAPGAVAAPTAGLHFDEAMLAHLQSDRVRLTRITLHVGAGTFQPVRVDNVCDHKMHAEWLRVSPAACQAVAETRARGGRVVAVGTTAMRALESAAASGELLPFEGETRLFVTPGYQFRVVDALVTNFHTPESTLLMLVSAFGGPARVMAAYHHAIAARYRFLSYGDAMLIERYEGPGDEV